MNPRSPILPLLAALFTLALTPSTWGLDGTGDPNPDPDADVTVTFNLDLVYLSDNMPVWRDSYFTVTPASRLTEIAVAGTGNDPGSFTATVEVYDLAQGKGRVRVKANDAGPKDFVAQLKLNDVVKNECTFQSFHLTAASAVDVLNSSDPADAAPLGLATNPASTLIRQPSNGTGLLVQHTEKGSITGSQYTGFNFQAAGTEAVFASPTDDTAETQVTGRVVVRFGTAPNIQEVLCNIPTVPVTIVRCPENPLDPFPEVHIVGVPRVIAADSSGDYPVVFEVQNASRATITRTTVTLVVNGNTWELPASENDNRLVSGDLLRGTGVGEADNGETNLYTVLLDHESLESIQTRDDSHRSTDVSIRLNVRFTTPCSDGFFDITSSDVSLEAFLDSWVDVVHVGSVTTIRAFQNRHVAKSWRSAHPYSIRMRPASMVWGVRSNIIGGYADSLSVASNFFHMTSTFGRERTETEDGGFLLRAREYASSDYNPWWRSGDTWAEGVLNEQRGLTFVFHYGLRGVTTLGGMDLYVVDISKASATSTCSLFNESYALLTCTEIGGSTDEVSWAGAFSSGLAVVSGVAVLASNPVGWSATAAILATASGGVGLIDQLVAAEANSRDEWDGARAAIFGGLVILKPDGSRFGTTPLWSTTAASGNGHVGGPDFSGGIQTRDNTGNPKRVNAQVTTNPVSSGLHSTWQVFHSSSVIAWAYGNSWNAENAEASLRYVFPNDDSKVALVDFVGDSSPPSDLEEEIADASDH